MLKAASGPNLRLTAIASRRRVTVERVATGLGLAVRGDHPAYISGYVPIRSCICLLPYFCLCHLFSCVTCFLQLISAPPTPRVAKAFSHSSCCCSMLIGGAAENAGIKVGDQILSVNGIDVAAFSAVKVTLCRGMNFSFPFFNC